MQKKETILFAPHLQKNNQLKVPVDESNAIENKCSTAALQLLKPPQKHQSPFQIIILQTV